MLADGRPFTFSSEDLDRFEDGTLALTATTLPLIGPAEVIVPNDAAPIGIRAGQTLVLEDGGVVGDHLSADWGSTLIIMGGQLGSNVEAVGAQITISGGSVGERMEAYRGSVVNMSGGSIGQNARAFSGSIVNIYGGSVGDLFDAVGSSLVNISGGSFGIGFRARDGTEVNISGGSFGNGFQTADGSEVNISGGSFDGTFVGQNGSEVNLLGTRFVLDGMDITSSLAPHDSVTIDDRDVTLSGVLADGSGFSLDLNAAIVSLQDDLFEPAATLTVTLV